MSNYWLDRAKERLQAEANQPSGALFDRLQAEGMINERGEVTGKLHRWDAFLAITNVKRAADMRQIGVFRCLKPIFGLPGSATIDISRDSMVTYLKEGKKVITAHWDDRLRIWREGCAVRLSAKGFILFNSADEEDNVGDLPEFEQTDPQLCH